MDLPSILWLQGYLTTLEDKTIVVVSHDRAFLDEVAQETILLRHNRLAYHAGMCCNRYNSSNHAIFRGSTADQVLAGPTPDIIQECNILLIGHALAKATPTVVQISS